MYAFWGQKQAVLCGVKLIDCRGSYKGEIPKIFWTILAFLASKNHHLREKTDLNYI